MSTSVHVADDEIRNAFAIAMSGMYRQEVPLYGDLLTIVEDVNTSVLLADPALATGLQRRGELNRLSVEYHGAIRLGTPEELSMMRRVFRVMGMYPVGYYDLSVAGIPVHSTCFRPTTLEELNLNPFRIFTSLLRLDLIEDESLRSEVEALLASRQIFSDRTIALVEAFEAEGGLGSAAAGQFVSAVIETFRWHSETLVDVATYDRLHAAHRLIADITCFKGPHINHLTPRTLDIDAAQAAMIARGMKCKAVIEGPPRRAAPILLRQTSFQALEEPIRFADGDAGAHAARFGEIEQRGLALTRRGHDLYDALLDDARGAVGGNSEDYADRLQAAFRRFPDDVERLRREGLGYFRYDLAADPRRAHGQTFDLEALVSEGLVEASPIVYEDFLPVSAAGIFRSNLGGGEARAYTGIAQQALFEQALGAPIEDPFALYEAVERASIDAVRTALAPTVLEDGAA